MRDGDFALIYSSTSTICVLMVERISSKSPILVMHHYEAPFCLRLRDERQGQKINWADLIG